MPTAMSEAMQEVLNPAILLLEVSGALAIVCGAVIATIGYARRRLRGSTADHFREFRAHLGRSILIGLEFLVGADIIRTITTELSADSMLSLGGLILIRALLSLTLDVEIEGRWPWQRWQADAERDRGG